MSNEHTPMMQSMVDMASHSSSDENQIQTLEKEVFGSELQNSPKAPVNIKSFIDGDPKEKGVIESLLKRIEGAVFPSAMAMGGPAPRQNEAMDRASSLTRKNLKPRPNQEVAQTDSTEMYSSYGEFNRLPEQSKVLFNDYLERTGLDPVTDAEVQDAIREQSIYDDLMSTNEEVRQKYFRLGEPVSDEYLRKIEDIRNNDVGNFDEMAAELSTSAFDKGDPNGQ